MTTEAMPGHSDSNEGLGGQLTAAQDPVADALDDMAALGVHWARNRERGRMPQGIRLAMLMVAREALAHADAAERKTAQRFADLCGPVAFARNQAMDELRAIGSQMANVCFNWSQEANGIGVRLAASDREMLANLHRQWDAALARLKTPNVSVEPPA